MKDENEGNEVYNVHNATHFQMFKQEIISSHELAIFLCQHVQTDKRGVAMRISTLN